MALCLLSIFYEMTHYIGKTVRMSGSMAVSQGDNQTYQYCQLKNAVLE